ncbi:hypothetical protein T484DRAFT_1740549 [Baffinella frigidus]|nr:hypothetical protein T484DRAFT_1740549 [Cryptophyta sp. CCMP2293]
MPTTTTPFAATPLEAGAAVPTGPRLPVAPRRAQWLQQMAPAGKVRRASFSRRTAPESLSRSLSDCSFQEDSFRHLDKILNAMTPFELQQFFVREGSGHEGSVHQGFTRRCSASCSDLTGCGNSSLTLDAVLARIRNDMPEQPAAATSKRDKKLRALRRTTREAENAPEAEPLPRTKPLSERFAKKILRKLGFRL